MIEGGTGGGKTISGLRFEKRVDLRKVIGSIPGYAINNNDVFFNERKVGHLYRKNKLYKNLLKPKKIDYAKLISKKLLPDEAILVFEKNILFVIEIKFQRVAGSVDEKLQTCDFKNRQYVKLLSSLGIGVKYVYILNDWFQKEEYRDVLKYVNSVGCYYFFNEIPLEFLGLPAVSKK